MTTTQTRVLPLAELSPDLIGVWDDILARNPLYVGPCFRPEFFRGVGRHYANAWVAVIENEDGTAFLPFSKASARSIAIPIPICDYQAILSKPTLIWPTGEILDSLGVEAWDFDNLITPNDQLKGIRNAKVHESTRVNLKAGFPAYLASMKEKGVTFKNLREKQKKIERDLGPLRFVSEESSLERMETLFEWKNQRFHLENIDWVKATLIDFHQEAKVKGILSTLFAGETLVAVHYGLRHEGTLHYWFPSFNPNLSKYTPGWLFVYSLMENLTALSCDTLDFGPGGEPYKRYFYNDHWKAYSGSFELNTPFTVARRYKRVALDRVRSTPWVYEPIRKAKQLCVGLLSKGRRKLNA